MNHTPNTNTSTGDAELVADTRRARTLRWLLKLGKADNLPLPRRIDFGQLVSPVDGRTQRVLTLELDDDTDVTGWANAVGAQERDELPVTGQTHTWTHVRACTGWRRDQPRVDWHRIEVTGNPHRRPRVDRAVTA